MAKVRSYRTVMLDRLRNYIEEIPIYHRVLNYYENISESEEVNIYELSDDITEELIGRLEEKDSYFVFMCKPVYSTVEEIEEALSLISEYNEDEPILNKTYIKRCLETGKPQEADAEIVNSYVDNANRLLETIIEQYLRNNDDFELSCGHLQKKESLEKRHQRRIRY